MYQKLCHKLYQKLYHKRTVISLLATIVLTAMPVVACRQQAPAADDQQRHIQEVVAAGGVVDSVVPISAAIDRFRAGMDRVDTLRSASSSVRSLVERWTSAVAARDTAELNVMLLDRAEFAWLYYPDSKMSKPPYEAPPQLLWGQLLASSNEGAQAAVRRFGGERLSLRAVNCPIPAVAERGISLYEGCRVELLDNGVAVPEAAWFGTIIEREGRFKFVGYANRL